MRFLRHHFTDEGKADFFLLNGGRLMIEQGERTAMLELTAITLVKFLFQVVRIIGNRSISKYEWPVTFTHRVG